MIKGMRDKGMSVSQIARKLERDRKTIGMWTKERELGEYIRRTQAPAKIDPLSRLRVESHAPRLCKCRGFVG
jgi:transposase